MTTIAHPDLLDHTSAAPTTADPAAARARRKPPPRGLVTRRQHLLISARLGSRERRIAKELAALVDSPSRHALRWQRVYTAPQREESLPEIDTWFRIDCAVGDLEGLRQAGTAAPGVKSTHWVIAHGVTRVLVGWDLTQFSQPGSTGACHGLLRSLFNDRHGSGARPSRPRS